jgi:hypothetical protein
MALCERCGSIHVVKAPGSGVDAAISFFTRFKPFICRRCGWRGRRAWNENAKIDRSHLALEPEAAYDPALADLDEERSVPEITSRRRRRGGSKQEPKAEPKAEPGDDFDLPPLTPLDPAELLDHQLSETAHVRKRSGRRKVDRMRRGRRREIIGAVAIAAGVMFLIVMLGLSGSCRGVI